jgi:hypothetical protein
MAAAARTAHQVLQRQLILLAGVHAVDAVAVKRNASTSASAGVAWPNGHQNSTAVKPALAAAAGRTCRDDSVLRKINLAI